MFSSPYSPFFTSGLLSSSTPAPPDVPLSPRRGSLPTDSSTRSPEDASFFYFTLQPPRREDEFRSFLSLDLAESQSMRSASIKRNASSKKAFRFPSVPEVPVPVLPRNSASLRMRFSRDSLRTIPSPKPAPSITLPELPQPSPISSAPPRLPSLPAIAPLELSLPSASIRISRTPFVSHRISVATKATCSTVCTRVRKLNRSEALAALEGRGCLSAPILVSPKHAGQENFMSMSDDEDDEDDGADSDLDSLDFFDEMFNPLMEPEDVVLPLPPSSYLEAPRSAPLPPREEPPSRPQTSMRRQRTGTRSSKDWFPLKSFIDLRNDDDSSNWSWRSFIEVANVS